MQMVGRVYRSLLQGDRNLICCLLNRSKIRNCCGRPARLLFIRPRFTDSVIRILQPDERTWMDSFAGFESNSVSLHADKRASPDLSGVSALSGRKSTSLRPEKFLQSPEVVRRPAKFAGEERGHSAKTENSPRKSLIVHVKNFKLLNLAIGQARPVKF